MHSNLNGSTLQSSFCYFDAVSHCLIYNTTVRPYCIAHVRVSELWPDRSVCQAGFVFVCGLSGLNPLTCGKAPVLGSCARV